MRAFYITAAKNTWLPSRFSSGVQMQIATLSTVVTRDCARCGYAINVTHPELVEIITWNGFIEGTYVCPIDDPNKYPNANYLNTTGVPTSTLGYFHSHSGATDLLELYIQWYKTGVQLTVTTDSIYWPYRTQSKGTTSTNNTPR